MEPVPLADTPARVATYTIDHLAYSPAPPVIGVVLDFEGGGRYACELTDATPAGVSIGMDVEMTFRRISENSGIQNYFWKARPVVVAAGEPTGGSA
nr:OB-fold domain-containing protein [Pseudonocardia sp. C8]